MGNRSYTYDHDLLAKDAGLVAASAAAQVSSADKILDLGAGRFDGVVVVDVTAIELDSNNEKYEIEVQLAPDAGFGTAGNIRTVATLKLGDSSVNGSGADSAAGRYEIQFSNEFPAGTVLRYMRIYTRIAGTIATGINFTAFVARNFGG